MASLSAERRLGCGAFSRAAATRAAGAPWAVRPTIGRRRTDDEVADVQTVTRAGAVGWLPGTAHSQSGAGDPSNTPPLTYESVFDELQALRPAPDRVATVSDLVLQRDVGTFTLRSGSLALLSPVGGETVAAVFVGDGVFTFAPPTRVEQEQLQRIFDADTLAEPFRTLFIVFTDSTGDELERRLDFAAGDAPSSAGAVIRSVLQRLGDRKRRSFDVDVMRTLLNRDHSGLFQAHLSGRRNPLVFEINPYHAEEVRLYREADAPGEGRFLEVLSQFHPPSGTAGGRCAHGVRGP